jgi:hypothetical protein
MANGKSNKTWITVDLSKSSKDIVAAFNAHLATKEKLDLVVAKALGNQVKDTEKVSVMCNTAWRTLSYAIGAGNKAGKGVAL